ncbi:MAG: type VII toxin-antitoxin system MntA family adenylyltransferase antitoxin [Deltaproteobacteria bacterium]
MTSHPPERSGSSPGGAGPQASAPLTGEVGASEILVGAGLRAGTPGAKLREAIVQRIVSAFPGVLAIYAHGSLVRGNPREDSDLDLALLLDRGATVAPKAWFDLVAELTSLAGRTVDLGRLESARSIVYCKEVIAGGERWATFDERAVAELEMQTLSAYADYREALAPVIAAYALGTHG